MNRLLGPLVFALSVAPCPGGPVRLVEDPPTGKPPKAGALSGVIENADRVARLGAVSRVTGKRHDPASFDRKTGKFLFSGLPGDARYDVCITTSDGRRIEGIDLSWFEARLLRLAARRRKDLGLPQPPPHAFGKADVTELIRFVTDRKDFSDVNRILYIQGHGDKAVVLAERIRTTGYYDAAGNYYDAGSHTIWRTDLWYFTFDAGAWQAVSNVDRQVERHSDFRPDTLAKFTLVYEADLSGYVDEDGRSEPIRFTVGKKLDPAKGRVAGSPFAIVTKPVVLGLSKPTSRPARPQEAPRH